MTDTERLVVLMTTTNRLVSIGETTNALLEQMILLLREPPSSELPDLIRALVRQCASINMAVTTNTLQLETLTSAVTSLGASLGGRISSLRDQIAKGEK